MQNIYIAAKHLGTLRDIDFKEVSSEYMNDNQIAITAERYNRGGAVSVDEIKYASNGYGPRILKNKSDIMRAIK